ncbi:MAG: CPBP family intramembrane metalloprotease [Sedimentisphaerales bacterium]|nr:CPBP family intramembrane metalloprotease [Sedimentisphaerales bacterium]
MPDEPQQLTVASLVTDAIYTIGVLVFAKWLISTSLGRRALVDSPARRNRMPVYTPLIPFGIWLLGTATLQSLAYEIIGHLGGWQQTFLDNLIYCLGALITVAVILLIAEFTFARGLRGFGLRPKTIGRDLAWAGADLLAVWPLVLAMIVLTVAIGRALMGESFEIPQHMGLEIITESTSPLLQVLIVVLAVVVAPLVEEMVFRGMIQTTLRSYFGRPWLAIAVTSAMFASVHENGTHWPALFVLGMGLGYSYEKSGSLFRPILMHALFNGTTILAALLEPPA